MCNFKSAFVLKPSIEGARPEILHCPGVDSHEEIARRLNIRDRRSASAGDLLAARIEFTPDWNADITKPEAWTLRVDEERKPAWWTEQVDDQVKAAMWGIVTGMLITTGTHKKVGGDWLVLGGETSLTLTDGVARLHNKATVTAWGSSTVTAWGSSTVTAWDSSTVTAWGSSTVTARDSSTVTAWGSSTVTARDSSTVTAWGSSTVTARDSSTVTVESSYAYTIGRGRHDGNGCPVLLATALIVGRVYRIVDGKFVGEPKSV